MEIAFIGLTYTLNNNIGGSSGSLKTRGRDVCGVVWMWCREGG